MMNKIMTKRGQILSSFFNNANTHCRKSVGYIVQLKVLHTYKRHNHRAFFEIDYCYPPFFRQYVIDKQRFDIPNQTSHLAPQAALTV